ncbi:MAG: Gx transporter family protein [Candidatus Delongbacteria bacterium]|jgi:heptaprenyl diphosphate synthase|nr:Gx transporter family protein [Candidatus Delongbacteria bacterium]
MKFTYSSRVYIIAVFAALASLLQLLEIFIILPIPFIKIGLANSITLYFLKKREYVTAFFINIIRIFVGGFFSAKLFSLPFLFSLSGGIISFSVMYFLIVVFRDKISIAMVSVMSAVAFNLTQYFLFSKIFGTGMEYDTTVSIIMLLSIPAGIITAIVVNGLLKLNVDIVIDNKFN